MPPAELAQRIRAIQNAAEVIAQSLREMICRAELRPGEPLIQERIAALFQVSRVPVRDALQLLIGMGLAVQVPRRGVIVRPLSRKHIEDLYEVRKVLEGAAIRLVARRLTPGLRARLGAVIRQQSECLDTGDVSRQARLDDEFHDLLFSEAPNDRLRELIQSNWEMIRQARCASVVTPRRGAAWIATSIDRHRRILAALSRGEAAAVAAVCDGIESSKREILHSLQESAWLDGSNGGPGRPPGGPPVAARRAGRARHRRNTQPGGA